MRQPFHARHRSTIYLFLILLVSLTLLPMTASASAARLLHISAAASLSDACRELIRVFDREHPGDTILPNFGSSGGLAKQIDQGAMADIFISANPQWMEFLIARKHIADSSTRTLAANSLVFVGRAGQNIASMQDLVTVERIAIGSPRSVPAGQYAKQAMEGAGVYNRLLAEGRLVMAKDVRQALVYADRAEVSGAFVYKTDALLAGQAGILFTVPPELHDPVTYPVALTTAGERNSLARKFYAFLAGEGAAAILEKHGFATGKGKNK
jgi:molybdate transport system substrate-binding protein